MKNGTALRMPELIIKGRLRLYQMQRDREIVALCMSAKNRIDYAEGPVKTACLCGADNEVKSAMGNVSALGAGASNDITVAEKSVLAAGVIAENKVNMCRGSVDTLGAAIAISSIGKTEGATTMSLLCSITDIKVLRKALVSLGGIYSMVDMGRAGPLVAAVTIGFVHSLNVIGEIRGLAASISAIGVNEIGRIRGIALATVNNIAELDGASIGVLNICKKRFNGIQIGLLNIDRTAKRFKALPFFRFNFRKRESIKTGPGNSDIC
jgi:hypothetical protein